MKRILCILMVALLALSALALAEPVSGSQLTILEPMTTEDKLYEMIPVLDSLTRNMGIEGEIAYSAADPTFLWTQIALMGQNWSSMNALVTGQGDQLSIPAELVQEYAWASFGGMQELPEIPETMTGIRYDANGNYIVQLGDAPTTYIMIERYAFDASGTLYAGVGLYDAAQDDLRLGGLLFTLTEPDPLNSAYASDFPYIVVNAAAEQETDFAGMSPVEAGIRYIALEAEAAETAPETTATTGYTSLRSGDRGEAVRKLQARLSDLGYSCGSADGIFGSKTRRAVRYFQDAIGANQNGVASASLQERLYASNAPEYVAYVSLTRGDSGIRVEKLQSRLRELGYLAEPTDGDFGRRTQEAVKLFQEEAGLKTDGVAGTKTLKALYKSGAPECEDFITLKRGDTGIRVKELQNKLRDLGFMTEKVSGTFDRNTSRALEAYMEAAGIEGDSRDLDAEFLANLFAYEPVVEPTEEPTVEPTVEPSVEPTEAPTEEPTEVPTEEPTEVPTEVPTDNPTEAPSEEPIVEPTDEPTEVPTEEPTDEPTEVPTDAPTDEPTDEPTEVPTEEPAEPVPAITAEQLTTITTVVNAKLGTEKTDAEAVMWIQQHLKLTQTGIYDSITKTAVATFQTEHALESTGIVDEATAAALAEVVI